MMQCEAPLMVDTTSGDPCRLSPTLRLCVLVQVSGG